ncbi:R3H domain-containing nucleic acid-binding protein [Spiroplasma sp. DGKH1]|uniref:R3H domain-containing nucleic acid-binding protein n=1 Tax=Spiroplasma sp. DGKH1 TaxID=3050074 RepID=UPI0034C6C294
MMIKIFKNYEEIKKYLNTLSDKHYYNVENTVKKFFSKKITVLIYQIQDVITVVHQWLQDIFQNILLINNSEMFFSIKSRTINIRILFCQQSDNYDNLVEVLTNLMHVYISRKFQNNFYLNIQLQNIENEFLLLINKWANEVVQTKNELMLPALPLEKRKIIHQVISRFPQLTSKSIKINNSGDKKIIIKYKPTK